MKKIPTTHEDALKVVRAKAMEFEGKGLEEFVSEDKESFVARVVKNDKVGLHIWATFETNDEEYNGLLFSVETEKGITLGDYRDYSDAYQLYLTAVKKRTFKFSKNKRMKKKQQNKFYLTLENLMYDWNVIPYV